MARGMSTVLDVGIACLLITTSAFVLVMAPTQPVTPPAADRAGRALLATTITVSPDGHPVETSVADVLANAATDTSDDGDVDETGGLSRGVRRSVLNVSRSIGHRLSVSAGWAGSPPRVSIGHRPPPGAAVDVAVFRVGTGDVDEPPVAIVVRTWSA